ncbi:hypothetical protein BH11PAT1_BH11PAT1_1940 [soil metagenome]
MPTPTRIPSVATPTPVVVLPGKTYLSLTVLLHGIGASGDSQTPTSGGNPNPLHTERDASVEIFSLTGEKIGEKAPFLYYKKDTGNFQAVVELDASLASGQYQIKIKADRYLRKNVMLTLISGSVNTLSPVTLIAGDINNDNKVDLLDYNILRGCISLLAPPKSCTAGNQVDSDMTDDGKVEVADRTLFIRELTNVQGD